MISIQATRTPKATSIQTDLLVFLLPEEADVRRRAVRDVARDFGISPPGDVMFRGKFQEPFDFHPTQGKARRVLLLGMGTQDALTLERFRRLGASCIRTARALKCATLTIRWPSGIPQRISVSDSVRALAEGLLLSSYRYTQFKTKKDERTSSLRRVGFSTAAETELGRVRKGITIARILAESVFLARDLENAPGNEIYPATLARAAGTGTGRTVSVRALGPAAIRKLGMGGLLGVGSGSARPPRFIIMEYRGARRKPVVLVGKGITFDSGGISIKPSSQMAEMKMDMSGAASVIATIRAAARLNLPVRLIGLIPAAENLPGGRALKPGDILKHLNGVTSEVDNTDAEGRLVLADALAYAQRYNPGLIIDVATLTGAVVVALGHVATGMMGTAQEAMDGLKAAGERTYERVWQLPLFEEYERLIESDVADVKNIGGKWAGAITAALFLKRFVGDTPWVHLDIAGTAMIEEPFEYITKGGSGVGVRLLIEFLTHWKSR